MYDVIFSISTSLRGSPCSFPVHMSLGLSLS